MSIVRKTLPAIKGSVFIDFKEILIKMGVWNNKCFNKSEMIYLFPNTSWVEFFSTDDEQKIRGRKRKILFVNEANEISENEWTQLKIRTTGLIVLDYNPSFPDDHWIEDVNKDKDTYHFISTYKDNPFLEQVVIEAIESLRDKNYSLWTIYGLGLRAAIEGRIFEKFEIVPEIPLWVKKQWVGLDFGYTHDPTAGVIVGIHGSDLYMDEKFYRTHMLTGDIIKALKPVEISSKKIISECADPRLVDEIYNAGLNIHAVEKGPGSVEAGILAMKGMNIKITKGSINAKKELEHYVYAQDKEGKRLNTPVDAFNHIMDAVRYVILTEVLGIRKTWQKTSAIGGFLPGVR
jgi:phage terminase large subunit